MTTWLKDDNGNKCSVEYFGSVEKAQAALDSLKNCENCTNCSDCSDCSRCSYCSYCSDCSDCSRCSYCSDCSYKVGKEKPPTIPKIENIHQKVFEAVSQPNAFDMSTWHKSCGTTHCRGGWVVHLAGEAGYVLEKFHNTELAAMLIYLESGYHINPSRFYDSNEDSLADMKRLAEEEGANNHDQE